MNRLEKILEKLPIDVGVQIKALPNTIKNNLEEIRIRSGQDIILFAEGTEYKLEYRNRSKIDQYALNDIFNSLLDYSAYAYQEELANGYITIEEVIE